MKFVGARDDRGTQQRKRGIQQESGTGQAHPNGAQPQQAHGSVAQEMATLPDVVMQNFPALVSDMSEDMFPNPAQRTAGMVRPKECS